MFEPTDANAALNYPAARGEPPLARFFHELILVAFALMAFAGSAGATDRISAVRIWPAQEYTRITIEADKPIRHELLLVKNPERLVLDLEDVDIASVQQEIAGKVLPNDPYIGQMRAGRYKPGVVRLVLDLKAEVKPQIFMLKPVGEYGHRLVLDVYPLVPTDPLMALLQKPEVKAEPEGQRTEPAPSAAQEEPKLAGRAEPGSRPEATPR